MEEKFLVMYEYVKGIFTQHEYKDVDYPFRNKVEHIKRVFMWASRILDNEDANRDEVLTAAIFHDVGYCISRENHPVYSAVICKKYLEDNKFDACFIDKVTGIIKNHDNKSLLTQASTSMEQIILIEADYLDEKGTLSILRDCMSEGKMAEQSYEQTFKRLKSRSMYLSPEKNPMATKTARKIWEDKKSLYLDFMKNLANDLGSADDKTNFI